MFSCVFCLPLRLRPPPPARPKSNKKSGRRVSLVVGTRTVSLWRCLCSFLCRLDGHASSHFGHTHARNNLCKQAYFDAANTTTCAAASPTPPKPTHVVVRARGVEQIPSHTSHQRATLCACGLPLARNTHTSTQTDTCTHGRVGEPPRLWRCHGFPDAPPFRPATRNVAPFCILSRQDS